MAENNIGKITQVIGAVIDIKFTDGNLPEINSAINIKTNDGGKLVVEVAQHLGDDVVRCIAMGPTDGLVRGMDAEATGAPISVPVGEQTLGRMFNVLGDPIDNKPAPEVQEHMPIHRKAPAFAEHAALLKKKKEAYPDYRKARDEMQELMKAQKNVEMFFAEEKDTAEKEPTR